MSRRTLGTLLALAGTLLLLDGALALTWREPLSYALGRRAEHTLPARLAAVETWPADSALLRQDPAAPAAAARLLAVARDGNGALRHRDRGLLRYDDVSERLLGSHASGR